MPKVQHYRLTGGHLHEQKAIATAVAKSIRLADGAGSTTAYTTAYGQIYFTGSLAVGTPTAFTVVTPTSIASGLAQNVTETTSGQLTYTGAQTSVRVDWQVTLSHDDASSRTIYVGPGTASSSAGAERYIQGTDAAQNVKVTFKGSFLTTDSTSATHKLWVKVAAGDITVHEFQLSISSRY